MPYFVGPKIAAIEPKPKSAVNNTGTDHHATSAFEEALRGSRPGESFLYVPVVDVRGTHSVVSSDERSQTACAANELCFDDARFVVTLSASDPRTGVDGAGLSIPQSDLFGYFALPDLTGNPENPEVFVKLLDGRGVNGHFWVFYGGLTDFEYTVTVTDTSNEAVQTYTKEGGSYCGGADILAFF